MDTERILWAMCACAKSCGRLVSTRGMYSNKAGYLAGVQLAIMVAKTVQFYPQALASTIVAKFFKVFHQVCASLQMRAAAVSVYSAA